MARWPVDKVKATPHGAYDYQRATRRHHGIDLAGKRGTVVVAPERLLVLATGRGLSTSHKVQGVMERSGHALARGVGLAGYGPGAVLALGLDTGMVHVLGHLDDGALPAVGSTVEEGATVGTVSRVGHVHWEVRKPDSHPWPRARRGDDTYDPAAYLEAAARLPFTADATAPTSTPRAVAWLDKATTTIRAAARASAAAEVTLLVLVALALGRRRA